MLICLSAPARAARPNQLPPACRPSPATLHEQDRPVRLAMKMSFSAQDGSDHLYVDGDRPRFLKKRLNSPIHRRDGHGIAAMDHQCVPGLLLPALRL
jgi:hypothetical protein